MSSVHTADRRGLNRLEVARPVRPETEGVWLRCLAHTLRLEGDYVSAQALERDLVGVTPVTALTYLGANQMQMKAG